MSQEKENIIQSLYWEKYRPQTLNDVVAPERIIRLVKNGIQTNMIFTGTSGLGKTTLARILIKNLPHIELSAKLGVDSLREKIDQFCRERVVNFLDDNNYSSNQLKVVYFEEFDRASKALQEELKSFMERYSETVRFIATTNSISSMDKNLLSRFNIIDFSASTVEEANEVRRAYANRLLRIVNQDNLPIDKPVLKEILLKNFPDFRAIWNSVQQVVLSGSDVTGITQSIGEQRVLFDIILTRNYTKAQIYDYLFTNWLDKLDSAFKALGRDFFRYVRDNHEEKELKLADAMDTLSEFTDLRLPQAPDPFVTLLALVCRYEKIFK